MAAVQWHVCSTGSGTVCHRRLASHWHGNTAVPVDHCHCDPALQ